MEEENELEILEEETDELLTHDWSVDVNYEIFQFRQTLKEGEPERNLYLAVILQALLDATNSTSVCSVSESSVIQSQASSWFFTSTSVSLSDFEYVCDMAGLIPNYT